MHTDSQHLEQAKLGDVKAFDALIREHLPTIRRFALAFASSQADADDLAQEAMVRAFRSIQSFRGESAFSTWLYRVTRNAYIDRTRSRWFRFRSASVPLESIGERSSNQESPEGQTIAEERRQYVWSVLRTMAPKYRNVLVLVDIEELDYGEVAKIEGIPVGTVRSRLSRGRAKLSEKLNRLNTSKTPLSDPSSRRLA